MNNFQYDTELKLGTNRGKPRVWIEGKRLAEAGFVPGRKFRATFSDRSVVLETVPEGDRTVSGKTREGGPHPIVDMNTSDLGKVFPDTARISVRMTANRIEITPARTLKQVAARVLTMTAVGLFVGGGLLSHAAKAAGFDTVAANEIEPAYAEVHDANHGGYMMNSSIEDADLHEVKRRVGPVGLLHAGIPCEPYSKIRRNDGNAKADSKALPETHDLGDMTFWTLRAIDILNPHTVVIEEVPAWLESASGVVAVKVLRRMGYTVDHRVINSADYGAWTRRKRAVLVATTFDSVDWPQETGRKSVDLSTILLPVDHPECEWFDRSTGSKQWLFDHWARQTAKGNGLVSGFIRYGDASVPVIKKRYLAGQGDNPVVVHPHDDTRYRWLTVTEIKRIMRLPDSYDLGPTKTLAGEILGQGVEVGTFEQIIRSVTRQAVVKEAAA